MANRVPPYAVSNVYDPQDLVEEPQIDLLGLQRIVASWRMAMHHQGINYQTIAEQWRLEIAGLRQEGTRLDTRAHELEDQLKGSEAAQKAMQAALQMQESENGTLQSAIKEVSEQNQQILSELEICKRENVQIKKSLDEQEVLIAASARRATTNDLLQKKIAERESLEVKLRKINEAMQQERTRISNPVALGMGVFVGLLTGGVGGFLMGLGGGQLASSVVTESANCPCMTAYHAQLASVQKQRDLVQQEIDRLQNLLLEQ